MSSLYKRRTFQSTIPTPAHLNQQRTSNSTSQQSNFSIKKAREPNVPLQIPEESDSDAKVEQFFWDFMNDPIEAQIETQIRDQIEAQQRGTSNQYRRFSRRYIERDHGAARDRLMSDYFVENPVYNDFQFRRRYRMKRHLFLHIVQTLSSWSPYFCQRSDAFGKVGFSPLHKCTVAMRMLAYGTPADMWDKNLRIAETTIIECMNTFCRGVIECFGPTYLRKPTREDIQRLLHIGSARGFPGMLGSVDCMHWQWRNCPVAWKG